MNNYIILTNKPWHNGLIRQLQHRFPKDNWKLVNEEKEFNIGSIDSFNPKKIFIPHWSEIISPNIYKKFECIVFHMTDLPYGRGGSPLQNLIVNGHKKTKVSAFKVIKGVDTGPIYLKKKLDLSGTAKEIFLKSSKVIYKMIVEIINDKLIPIPQTGEVKTFRRRTPEQSDISHLSELDNIFDYIRMLDCDGYPKAYIEINGIKYEFDKVKYNNNSLEANVRIKRI